MRTIYELTDLAGHPWLNISEILFTTGPIACENIRFSFSLRETSPAAKSEEKRMFFAGYWTRDDWTGLADQFCPTVSVS